MHCDCCGGPLASYEGEHFCPDCTRFEIEELARQADDEARILRQFQAQAEQTYEGPADDGPPF
jgi:uncharacterized Zn finger protein (UPF0148 family)